MARVTVEDCLKNVDNRFDLVLKAAKRAHDIEMGVVVPMVEEDNDKPTVIALREIAAGFDITRVVKPELGEDELSLAEAEAAFITPVEAEIEVEVKAEAEAEVKAEEQTESTEADKKANSTSEE